MSVWSPSQNSSSGQSTPHLLREAAAFLPLPLHLLLLQQVLVLLQVPSLIVLRREMELLPGG